MQLLKSISLCLIQVFTVVHCINHQVLVGQNNALTFAPSTVRAFPGDTVQFIFAALNHTVTSSSPLSACQPDGLLNSGFVPVSNATAAAAASQPSPAAAVPVWKRIFQERAGTTLPSFTITVLDFLPRTIYCAQSLHCQNGMVMVINPALFGPASLESYTSLSANAEANVAPAVLVGGFLRNAPGAVAGAQITQNVNAVR